MNLLIQYIINYTYIAGQYMSNAMSNLFKSSQGITAAGHLHPKTFFDTIGCINDGCACFSFIQSNLETTTFWCAECKTRYESTPLGISAQRFGQAGFGPEDVHHVNLEDFPEDNT